MMKQKFNIEVINKHYVAKMVKGKRRTNCVIDYIAFTDEGIKYDTAWIGFYCYPASGIEVGELYQMTKNNNWVTELKPLQSMF